MRTLIVVSVAACFLSNAALAQQDKPDAVRGVWKLSQGVDSKGQTRKVDGLLMLTERHYSLIQLTGDDRPATEPGSVSDADKIKLFDTIIANAGTYELSGKTLTMHVQFAKNQGVVGRTMTAEIDVTGKTLVVMPGSGPGKGSKLTFERVEP